MSNSNLHNVKGINNKLPTNDLIRYKFEDLPEYIKHMADHKALCIIPLQPGTKIPRRSIKWTKYRGVKSQYPLNRLKNQRGNFALIMGDPLKWGMGHTTILDIDDKKGMEGVYKVFKDIDTLQVKTSSKGFHIYFISEKPVKDKDYIGKLFNLDIELRGNPGNLTTLPPSCIKNNDGTIGKHEVIREPSNFKIIDVSDVEEFVKEKLETAGYEANNEIKPIIRNVDYITPSINGRWDRSLNTDEVEGIVTRLKPFYKEGNRQNICLWVSGWMQKAEISYKSAKDVIELLSINDTKSEINQRISALKSSYRGLESQNNKGSSGIYDMIKSYYENKHKEIDDEDFRNKKIVDDTHSKYFAIHEIIVHPLSILGVKETLSALREGIPGVKKHIKIISRFLRNRFEIAKNDLTGELGIYKESTGIYELYNGDKFLEFLSNVFNDELFTMDESKTLKSIFARTKIESGKYIAFNNCLLDLETLEPEQFDHEEFVTFQVPYDWNPDANGGIVKEKLREILIDESGEYAGKDDKFLQFLQLVGYCFEKGNPRQKIFIFIGPPGSGKTQLVRTIGGLFKGGVASVPLQQFKERFGLQPLINKRINTIYDISKKEINDPSIIKAVSGNDSITIDRKNKEPITLEKGLPVKTIGSGNELPRIVDESGAMWERLIIINLTNIFRQSDNNEYELAEMLLEDNEGISWLIYNGIKEYKKIKNDKSRFIMELDSVQAGIEYLKQSDPCHYAAQKLFYKTNNENDFYTTSEIITMISELLQNEGLRIPKNNKEYSRAIMEIGGEKVQRRINDDSPRGYMLIKPRDDAKDPVKHRLNYETIIGVVDVNMDYPDLTKNELELLELMTSEKLELNGMKAFSVKELIHRVSNELDMDKDVLLTILGTWKLNGWLKIDNSAYFNKKLNM